VTVEFPGEFQREITAQRVAGEGEACQAVDDELAHHRKWIGGETRVIQPAGQVLGAAAVALVETDDVEAARPRLVGHPAHVVAVARPFEAMQQDDRERRDAVGLPVAVAEHLGVVGDPEQPRLGRWQAREVARPRPRVQRHAVPAGEGGVWDERPGEERR
jgi:hypothetical protein